MDKIEKAFKEERNLYRLAEIGRAIEWANEKYTDVFIWYQGKTLALNAKELDCAVSLIDHFRATYDED